MTHRTRHLGQDGVAGRAMKHGVEIDLLTGAGMGGGGGRQSLEFTSRLTGQAASRQPGTGRFQLGHGVVQVEHVASRQPNHGHAAILFKQNQSKRAEMSEGFANGGA